MFVKKTPQSQSGSALIEALVSVLIFFVGLIALVGMSTQANNQISQSRARNEASNLASELVGDMWTSSFTPATFDTTAWQDRVADELPSGAATVTVTGKRINIVITWTDPKDPGATPRYETTAEITKND